MAQKSTLVVREPAHVQIASRLRTEILGGTAVPGAQLRQDEIGKKYGVSQATVREAFRSLEAEGLLTSFRNRGVFVKEVTVEQVTEVYVLRECLEVMALSQSFEHLKEKDFLKAQKLLERSEKKEAYSFVGASNRAFHEVFYSAGGQTLTIDLLGRCFGGITPSWMRFIREQPDNARAYEKESSQHHWELLRACRAGALEEAKSVLSTHLQHASAVLTKFLIVHPKDKPTGR